MIAARCEPSVWRHPARASLARAAESSRTLVLTFDDGPGNALTALIARLLEEAGTRATFFLLGRRATAHPETVDMLAQHGHELACHTHDHTNAWKCLPHVACRDIERGYESLSRWIGPDAMFRPPYGKLTPWTARTVARRGARIGWWTIDSGDTWRRLPPVSAVTDAVAKSRGGVVLLHDFDREGEDRRERAEYVLEVTRACIRTARAEGLSIVTLGELLDAQEAGTSVVE